MKKIGYNSAKELINKKFGREVYTDEILLPWIGIDKPRKVIFEASQEGIENAYIKADEINKKVGQTVIRREVVDLWVKEEKEKISKKQSKSKNEEDAR